MSIMLAHHGAVQPNQNLTAGFPNADKALTMLVQFMNLSSYNQVVGYLSLGLTSLFSCLGFHQAYNVDSYPSRPK